MSEAFRPAWVEVDLDAIAHNCTTLARLVEPARLCAVVKADGYGHGAVEVSRAALRGGASLLAVALVEEGVALREAGIDAPVLLLSEPSGEAMDVAVANRLTPTLYRMEGVRAASDAARAAGARLPVHVKVDTGMHRVGADPDAVIGVVTAVAASESLELEGLYSHLAMADEPADEFTVDQLKRFETVRDELAGLGIVAPLAHIANSAGAIAHPATRLDLVRCGIACYGCLPSPDLATLLPPATSLRPALSLKAEVHLVRNLPAGSRPSYGRIYPLLRDGQVAVVPIGYHDGVPRALARTGGEVLIGGRRRPIAGMVTMDQLIVDCGAGHDVRSGDEVVLIGSQGDEEITAWEWAERLSTIAYEVLCGIGPRVPRRAVETGR